MIVHLTNSQRMALCDILLDRTRNVRAIQKFHDVTANVTTTAADLLVLFMEGVEHEPSDDDEPSLSQPGMCPRRRGEEGQYHCQLPADHPGKCLFDIEEHSDDDTATIDDDARLADAAGATGPDPGVGPGGDGDV